MGDEKKGLEFGREVPLPSGNILKVVPAGFPEARRLFQAVIRQIGGSDSGKLKGATDNVVKGILAATLGSEEVDLAARACLIKCLYFDGTTDKKINDALFEDVKFREDYVPIILEIELENVLPFVKSLLSGSPAPSTETSASSRKQRRQKTI